METSRIIPGQNQPPAKLTGAEGKGGSEDAFRNLAKSNDRDPKELEEAVNKKTQLTRAKRTGGGSKNEKIASLFKVLGGGNTEEEAVYYTVLDPTTGQIMTLRLLAVA